MEKFKHEYGANQIQVLEGLGRKKKTRYVYRECINKRITSPCI